MKLNTYINPSMRKYINAIESGKIPAPYKIEFRNTKGKVVREKPFPLTPTGKPKIDPETEFVVKVLRFGDFLDESP